MRGRYALVELGGVPQRVDLLALPKVTITTTGGAPIVNTVDYVSGTITITGRGSVATRTTQIRGRGNTTWEAPKKPYKVKLSSAASLVPGAPSDRDWVLLANYYDPSSVRTTVAMELGARCTGLTWTPRFRHVEVTLNGVWQGLYQLGEHVKVASNRINIDKPGSATSGLPLTGGYTLEIDHRMGPGEGFYTPHDGLPVAFDEPDGTTPAQAAYIEGFVDAFETALYAGDWLNPATGYARFIDRDSFIDWYLVNELTMNLDSDFFSSCKLYKTRDTAGSPGRLHMGPLWDFDNSMGNTFGAFASAATGFHTRTDHGVNHPGATWLVRMFEDPAFAAAAWTRWQALAATLGDVDELIDRAMAINWPAAARDQASWGYTAKRETTAQQLTTWLTARIAWLTGALEP
jgi:hypothetical protein